VEPGSRDKYIRIKRQPWSDQFRSPCYGRHILQPDRHRSSQVPLSKIAGGGGEHASRLAVRRRTHLFGTGSLMGSASLMRQQELDEESSDSPKRSGDPQSDGLWLGCVAMQNLAKLPDVLRGNVPPTLGRFQT
jgi:hypothetical protein